MAVVHFEIVTAEVVGAARSGAYLLFTFLGGSGFFVGPIIGAVGMVVSGVLLSEWSAAWLLYLGLLFVGMVMYAPGGLASIGVWHLRWMSAHACARLWGWYGAMLASAVLACLGATSAIEFFYHQQLQTTTGQPMRWLGMPWDTEQALPWLAAALALFSGLACLAFFKRRWQQALAEIEPLQRQGKT
jgi:branched-chain amino acid transport system permease protein